MLYAFTTVHILIKSLYRFKSYHLLSMRGGFYPTAMGAILRNGPIFISSAVITALKLIGRDGDRAKVRKKLGFHRTRTARGRASTTRKVKRTKK